MLLGSRALARLLGISYSWWWSWVWFMFIFIVCRMGLVVFRGWIFVLCSWLLHRLWLG